MFFSKKREVIAVAQEEAVHEKQVEIEQHKTKNEQIVVKAKNSQKELKGVLDENHFTIFILTTMGGKSQKRGQNHA